MELRRNLTGGLAWAGLVIVVAVPTVEAVRSRLMHDGAGAAQTVAEIEAPAAPARVAVPVTQPIVAKAPAVSAVARSPVVHAAAPVIASSIPVRPAQPAPKPAVTQVPVSNAATVAASEAPKSEPPVTSMAPAAVVATTAPVVTPPPQADSGKGTALEQYLATGKPLPSYLKATPAPAAVASTPPSTEPTGQSTASPAAPTQLAATDDTDDANSLPDPAAETLPPPVPMPVAARPKIVAPPQRLVTEADLKGWKSGSLADYLRQRGLLSSANDSGNN